MPRDAEKSITDDEIEIGVFNPPPDDLPPNDKGPVRAFFYFRKDEVANAIPDEDARPGAYQEFALPKESEELGAGEAARRAGERAAKLEHLKSEVERSGLPVRGYDGVWDAETKRLVGLEKFGESVFADLFESIKGDPKLAGRFSAVAAEPPDEFTNEAGQMEAFIEERCQPDRYILGYREPLMRDMLAFAAADGAPNIFLLTGEPGSGKSAFLAKFVRSSAFTRRGEPPDGGTPNTPLLLPHFIGTSTGSTDLRRTLRRLCHELANAVENTEPLPLDIKELIAHFQKLLTAAGAKQRVILVFDGLNQFDATDGAHWLKWLPPGDKLPPGGRIRR